MENKKVGIMFSTYNSDEYVEECVNSCLNQDYSSIEVIVADDGSTDKTVELLQVIAQSKSNLHVIPLEHGERGVARKEAYEKLISLDCHYIYILDSDMMLKDGLISACVKYIIDNPPLGALVIPEEAWSPATNYYSKVKVFERNILNNAGEDIGANSIEAARFWILEEYKKTGGINPKQISFEETQPTIRYIEDGGLIKRATFTGVLHNEKMVTLGALLKKKGYYFGQIDKTLSSEKAGFMKALSRWYFFRPVLYRGSNIASYFKHPLLAIGMFWMYILLSFQAVFALVKSRLKG